MLFIRGLGHNVTFPGYGPIYFDAGLGIYIEIDGELVEAKFSGYYVAANEFLCEVMDQ